MPNLSKISKIKTTLSYKVSKAKTAFKPKLNEFLYYSFKYLHSNKANVAKGLAASAAYYFVFVSVYKQIKGEGHTAYLNQQELYLNLKDNNTQVNLNEETQRHADLMNYGAKINYY